MTHTVDLYWSFRSPYSYIVVPKLLELERDWDAKVQVKPVLPIAVRQPDFFAQADPLWFSYLMRDCIRSAEFAGMTLRWPRPDPVVMDFATRTYPKEQPYIHRLTRLGQLASERGHGLALLRAVSHVIWSGEVEGWHEGDHLANALAAIAACNAAGVPVAEAVHALASFAGLARRFDIVGTSTSGITVIDDFGHNPEKCAATLRTLKAHPGRVIAFFQPHGYGPLRQMGHELAETFARELGADDLTILCDPVYFGGTVDRSEGSERIVALIEEHGGKAEYVPAREDCAARIAQLARPGDRVVIMGARDDTLSLFARDLLARL